MSSRALRYQYSKESGKHKLFFSTDFSWPWEQVILFEVLHVISDSLCAEPEGIKCRVI